MQPTSLTASLEKKLQFLQVDPDNPNLLAEVADSYLRLDKLDEADKHLSLGLTKHPHHPALNFVKGSLAIVSNELDKAIAAFESLTYEVGTAHEVSYNLAYCYLLKGMPEQTQTILAPLVTELNPYLPAHLLYARACHHLGEMMDAITHVEDYLFKSPENDEAFGLLAMLLLDSVDLEAEEWADKALAINPQNKEALLVKGTLALEQLSLEDAIHFYQQVNHIHTRSGRANSGLGLIALAYKDFNQARLYLEKAVQDMPNHIGTWHILAWCQIFQHDLAAAKQSFEQANTIDRNFGETYGGLAVIAVLEGDVERSRTLSKKALGLDPHSFSARYAQSLIITSKGGAERAQKMIQQVLDAELDNQESLQSMLVKIQKKTQPEQKH